MHDLLCDPQSICLGIEQSILVKSGDAEMRFHHGLIFLLLSLTAFAGCGEDAETPEDPIDEVQNGEVQGIVTNDETGEPVEGASVSIGDKTALTNADGKYVVQEVPFSDEIAVGVTAIDYRDYETTTSLDQWLAIFDISLVPVDSPTDEILGILESLSQDIAALDPGKIPDIQALFSVDYVAASDPVRDLVTIFAISRGVVPPNFDGIPDAVLTIVGKYDKLEFKFSDPDVEFEGDTASVLMQFEAYAETKPGPDPAKKWEIIIEGKINLRKENGYWKITFWQLIPDFIKFEEELLE